MRSVIFGVIIAVIGSVTGVNIFGLSAVFVVGSVVIGIRVVSLADVQPNSHVLAFEICPCL